AVRDPRPQGQSGARRRRHRDRSQARPRPRSGRDGSRAARSEEHTAALHSLPPRRASDLQSEILALKPNPERAAEGTVIEAKLDRGRGPVATVLVQRDRKSTRLLSTLSLHDALPICSPRSSPSSPIRSAPPKAP